jgi:hypothetical protein
LVATDLSSSIRDEPQDALDLPPRRQLPNAAPRTVKFVDDAATGASELADRGSVVIDAKDLRTGYSNSAAHLTSQENGSSLRWYTLCANVSFTHDCEYIARYMPHHFAVHSMHHSTENPSTLRLLDCAAAHTWHNLSAVIQNSQQLKHALLQVLQICIGLFYARNAPSGNLVASSTHQHAAISRYTVGCARPRSCAL